MKNSRMELNKIDKTGIIFDVAKARKNNIEEYPKQNMNDTRRVNKY